MMPQNKTIPTSENFESDQALWDSFKEGDQAALSIIYNKHFKQLHKYGVFISHDRDLVQDCLQELFCRLWSHRGRIAHVHCVRVYLFKSFHRLLIRQLVDRRKWIISFPAQTPFAIMPPFEQTLIEGEVKSEQVIRLQEHIRSLTKGQREVIFLKFFNDLSYTEISEIMELQVDSVYNLASKALDLLRKKFQPQTILTRAA